MRNVLGFLCFTVMCAALLNLLFKVLQLVAGA